MLRAVIWPSLRINASILFAVITVANLYVPAVSASLMSGALGYATANRTTVLYHASLPGDIHMHVRLI